MRESDTGVSQRGSTATPPTNDDGVSRIFRYTLPITDGDVVLPLDHQLLSVAPGRDGYYIDLWARVAPGPRTTTRRFRIYGTGHPIIDPWRKFGTGLTFIGTAVMSDGLVWHVFAEPVRAPD